jgi:hypothetical protein
LPPKTSLPKEFIRELTQINANKTKTNDSNVIPAKAGISERSFSAHCRLWFGMLCRKFGFGKEKPENVASSSCQNWELRGKFLAS